MPQNTGIQMIMLRPAVHMMDRMNKGGRDGSPFGVQPRITENEAEAY